MKKILIIAILLHIPLFSIIASSLLGIDNADSQSRKIFKPVTSPLSGDYLVGLNAFKLVSGKNLQYQKFKETVMREIEVLNTPKIHKTFEKSIVFLDHPEILTFTPKITIQKEVKEEHYRLTENGKIYNGALTFGYPNEVFATLTEAITNLNNRGVSGNVRFLLTDTLYNEVSTMTINIISNDTTTSSRTLTIKPDIGVNNVKISTTSNNPVFIVYESYITFDGSNLIGGSTRDMLITNAGNSTSSGSIFVSNGSNVTIKNLICSTKSSSTSYNIVFDNSLSGLVENCELKRATLGIQVQSNCSNFLAKNNDIGSSFTADKIQNLGIGIVSTTNFTIEGNRIIGLERPYSVTTGTFGSVAGILVGNQFGGVNPSDGIIINNIIRDIKHTGIDEYAYAALGIRLSGAGLNSNITISNNFISDILGEGDAGVFYNPHGIFIEQGGGYKIYFNSVNLFGHINNSDLQLPAYTGAITIFPPNGAVIPRNLDIRNNIFVNSQTIAVNGSNAYAIYCGIADTSFNQINYNNYHVSGINGILGYLGTNRNDISAWRMATNQDQKSKSKSVFFISNIDLHLSGSSIGDKSLQGISISTIYYDIDNQLRHPAYPYIGADEITTSPLPNKLNLTVFIEGFTNEFGTLLHTDTIQVILADSVSPFNKIDTAKCKLNSSGIGTLYFENALRVSYFIIVNHRNSIETWSSTSQSFSSGELSYDFSTTQTKAYGNNLIQKGTKWCVFSGDVDQDGSVDLTDMIEVDNDNANFVTGYVSSDVNGDENTDLSDLIIVDNNNSAFVGVVTP